MTYTLDSATVSTAWIWDGKRLLSAKSSELQLPWKTIPIGIHSLTTHIIFANGKKIAIQYEFTVMSDAEWHEVQPSDVRDW